MKIKIKKSETNNIDYRKLVIEKFYEIGCFRTWVPGSEYRVIGLGLCANDKMFARCGAIQSLLFSVAYFGINRDGLYFSINDCFGKTWKDVYDIIKDIESIEFES